MKLAGAAVAFGLIAAAQQTNEVRVSAHDYVPPQFHITANATLVQMDVVVRDPRGHAVGGLKQTDFEILDEGNPRAIAAFSEETHASMASGPAVTPTATLGNTGPSATAAAPGAPRSTLLFFDNLHVTPAELQRMQAAATHFVRSGMGLGARAAVYGSSEGIARDFTSDADALIVAIQKLRSHQHLSENGLQPCPRITPYTAYLIDERYDYTALNAAVQEFQSCSNSDPSLRQTGPAPRNPKPGSPYAPAVYQVQAIASATMQQVRTDSLKAFDAVDDALSILARAPGARVLMMVSSGFISGMLNTERDQAIDRAIHSGIVINALDAKGLWTEAAARPSETVGSLPLATYLFESSTVGSRNDELNDVMQQFASATGGLFFHNNNDLAGGFGQLVAVPESTYLIAFSPDPDAAAGQYRKLRVRLAGKSGDYVQARPGYVIPATRSAASSVEARPIDRAVMGSDVLAQFPMTLAGRFGKGQPSDPSLSLVIHVDLSHLKFSDHGERHAQRLIFIAQLLDAGGKMVAAKEGTMELALKDDTLARLTASGVNATLGLNAPPGAYKLRVVAADVDGKLAAQNQTVEIPK